MIMHDRAYGMDGEYSSDILNKREREGGGDKPQGVSLLQVFRVKLAFKRLKGRGSN